MKKMIGVILVLCLVFTFAATAFAGSRPEITKQPESATTNKKGTVQFSVKIKGSVNSITWHFINPATGEDFTGKQLPKQFKGLKVGNPNGKTITLKKVPEAMHGWTVYVHINGNAYKLDSEKVTLWVYGLEQVAPAATEPPAESPAEGEQPEGQDEGKPDGETGAQTEDGSEASDDEPRDKTVTVSATKKILRLLDDAGNPADDKPVSKLEFLNSANILVSSEEPIKSWTINGVRIEPAEPVSEFKLLNVSSDLSMTFDVIRSTAATAQLDESHMCKVTCKGCTFTYLPRGYKNAAEGEVPAGAPIRIIAGSTDLAANGYIINGADPDFQGMLSIQITVTEDITIELK